MVMEVLHEEMGEGSLQCMNHLYRYSAPGGICAFCLQEKLGKLVSSSFSVGVFPSSAALQSPHLVSSSTNTGYDNRRSRFPFMLHQRRRRKKDEAVTTSSDPKAILFQRSKSTSSLTNGVQLLNDESYPEHGKNRVWSFRFMSKQHRTSKKSGKKCKDVNFPSRNGGDLVVVDENGSPDEVSFDRKVSRSRSVGCGSRSFSGDFLDRISSGFGDCALRRVESQREGRGKVKCGGILSGLIIPSSSASSSSSNEESNLNGKSISAAANSSVRNPSKSWGWASASPMRAFGGKPSAGKRFAASSKDAATPNYM